MKAHILRVTFISVLFLAGCGDDHRSPTQPPIAPAANITGSWAGRYVADWLECGSSTGPASATFAQAASVVHGTLSAASPDCGFSEIEFEGTLEGTTLRGQLFDLFPNANARGTVFGAHLEIAILNVYGYEQGVMSLDLQ